jgi:hypothetical protein
MTDRLTKLILTVAAVMTITTAQAAETPVCRTSPATCIIYVRPNSVTIWEAPEPFKQVFVGSKAEGSAANEDKGSAANEGKDLITAIAADDRHLVLTVREPKENLFGFGEAIIGRGNVLLYGDHGKEVAHLIVEVTPLRGPSNQIKLIFGRHSFRLECGVDSDDIDTPGHQHCYPAFKPREPTATDAK